MQDVRPQIFKCLLGTYKDQRGQAGPWSKRPIQDHGDKGDSLRAAPLKSSERGKIKVGGKEEVQACKAHALPFPKDCPNQSPTDLPTRKKHGAVPPRLLNVNPLAQIIGTKTVVDIIINDAKACALLDSGSTADLMTLAYAEARNFDIRLMTELSDRFVNLRLAARFKTTLSGYIEYNLQIPGTSSYNLDQVALVAEDNNPFSKEVPLTIGTKTEDTILEVLKEGKIEMLDSVWKRVKNNQSLSKLREEVGIQEAMIQVAKANGQEPPKFEDHTPYSNWGMGDLLN